MKRGEIWAAAGASGYAGKPRSVVVIQDDRFDATESVTICAFTTDPTEAPLIRLRVEPSKTNGLHQRSSLMVDKITTVDRSRLTKRLGRRADEVVIRLDRAIAVFSGIGAPRASS